MAHHSKGALYERLTVHNPYEKESVSINDLTHCKVPIDKQQSKVPIECNTAILPTVEEKSDPQQLSAKTTRISSATAMDPESILLELFCPTTIQGEFNFDDFLPIEPLIDQRAPVVPDLFQLPFDESEFTTVGESLLDNNTISVPSPDEDFVHFDPGCGLDMPLLEKYINLTEFEACTDINSMFTPSEDNILENPLFASISETATNYDPIPDFVAETENLAEVPELTEDLCAVLLSTFPDESQEMLDNFIHITPSDAQRKEEQLVTLQSLLDDIDATDFTQIQDQGMKRELVVLTDDHCEFVSAKRQKTDVLNAEEIFAPNPVVFDKITKRRVKNNEASKICRATRKAKHQNLFEHEKQLIADNKELAAQVEELSNAVTFLRQHLVNKLSAQQG